MVEINLFGRNTPVNETPYDEVSYWGKREHVTSSDEIYFNPNYGFIESQINHWDNVLDLGVGEGRLLSAMKKAHSLTLCDISPLNGEIVMSKALELGVPARYILLDKIHPIPFSDKEFDVAVASQVLLHQRPCNILPVMKELARVADRVVCISSYEEGWFFDEPGGPIHDERRGCFNYDYNKIVKENGWEMLYREVYVEQIFFTYKSK